MSYKEHIKELVYAIKWGTIIMLPIMIILTILLLSGVIQVETIERISMLLRAI